jgi:pectate lyase
MGCSPPRGSLLALALLVAAFVSGCGTDVAQTAVTVSTTPEATLDCTPPSEPPVLPTDPKLGGDREVEAWELAPIGAYDVGRGPGITLAALDGFRLFVNGHLLAESTTSLVPTFVPLTLLPGDNAIAVVVTAEDRPPALLVALEELERTYATGTPVTLHDGRTTRFKVAVEPSADFSQPDFDASGWDEAFDRGAPDDNPGCDPGPGFPAGTDAHFLEGPAIGTAVFRLSVPIAPTGFAAGTTGGGVASPTFARDRAALAAALEGDEPKVVLIPEVTLDVRRTGDDVTETASCPTECPADSSVTLTQNLLPDGQSCDIELVPAERRERRFTVGSNTTLVGLGRGAALLGGSLDIGGSTNVIVRNVALFGVNEQLIEAGDGISIDGGNGIWIDHVTFRWVSDGFVDATTGSENLTLSWVKNTGDNPYACFERHPRSNELADSTATIHHTLWQRVDGRAPLATRSASRLHLFDNVVTDDVSYAVGSACGAQVLLEATTFEGVRFPTAKLDCTGSSELGLIRAAGGGNVYGTGVGRHQAGGADAAEPADPVFEPAYPYVVDPAAEARYVVLERAGAGSRWQLPLALP